MCRGASVRLDVSFFDLVDCSLDDSQLGILFRHFVSYVRASFDGEPGLGSFDGMPAGSFLFSCWSRMKEKLDEVFSKRRALSAVRKAAGSMGGKQRALRYHKPDGCGKRVPVGSSFNGESLQQPLYSAEELDSSCQARAGNVRVLRSALAGTMDKVSAGIQSAGSFLRLPQVALQGNVGLKGQELLAAVGSGVSSVSSAVPVSSVAPVMVFPVGYVQQAGLFGQDVPPEKEVHKKRVSRSGHRSVPPKSSSLVDNTPCKRYGEFENVVLSDMELEKLKKEFPDTWENWIRRCDEYCERNHKEYKNYLMTIRAWARKDKARGVDKPVSYSGFNGSKGTLGSADAFVSKPEDKPFYDASQEEYYADANAAFLASRRRDDEMNRRADELIAQGVDPEEAISLSAKSVWADEKAGKVDFFKEG